MSPLRKSSAHSKQRGNVLFLILIAVALFAALSYAVTQSTRGGGNTDSESIGLKLASLTQYGDAISSSILRSRVINKLEDWEICFHANNWGNNDYLADSPNDICGNPETNVFSGDGMGISWQEPDETLLDTSRSGDPTYGDFRFTSWRIQDVGVDSEDDVLLFLSYLKRDSCLRINEELGIVNTGGEPPVVAAQIASASQNTYNCKFGEFGSFCVGNGSSTRADGANDELAGQHSGCFYSTNLWGVANGYVYYKVLVER